MNIRLQILINTLLIVALLCCFASAKEYNGSAWVADQAQYYNGSAWVDCTKNRYDGTAWAVIEAGGCSSNLSADQGPTAQTTSFANEDGRMYYSKFTADATGTANVAKVLTQYGGDAGENIFIAVYDSNYDLVGNTNSTATSGNFEDQVASLTANVCIENGQDYYVATQVADGFFLYMWYGADTGNNLWYVSGNTFTNGPPSTINPATDSVEAADSQINIRLGWN